MPADRFATVSSESRSGEVKRSVCEIEHRLGGNVRQGTSETIEPRTKHKISPSLFRLQTPTKSITVLEYCFYFSL